jgi:hypothetical protein
MCRFAVISALYIASAGGWGSLTATPINVAGGKIKKMDSDLVIRVIRVVKRRPRI